ncbi:DUF411 domain-containing protein [Methylonatrum kenyense]|uniref:DUF411 domain-containing protein n=1 Tax=Methylonatrum kenyense TaxID=455253 RepID=UPI0020C0D3B6|nr:DUF411 domain-containing protein [Methylonatrum kenyense]MCK8516720.1 DUF411 domain-containing protein [Methylonatrum kenyense]
MKRPTRLALLAGTFLLAAAGAWMLAQAAVADKSAADGSSIPEWQQTEQDMKVFKTPQCGCCTDWVVYLREQGMSVEAVDVTHQQLNQIKMEVGLSRELASCHTGFIDGYVIEGHVPHEDVLRLLDERPDVAGLAVPGMPVGSPGMEMGDRFDPYHVLSFSRSGDTEIFSTYHQLEGTGD